MIELSDYDPLDLAEKAGALQLLPENADFYVELMRCSALVAALPAAEDDLLRLPDHSWREWINSAAAMSEGPELGSDPHEGLLVAEVPCYGGAYLTLPSENPEDPFILECLLESVLLRMDANDLPFRQLIAEIALSGLLISDQCVRRAGLGRATPPGDTENGEIRWPTGQKARDLQYAVRFSFAEITEALSEQGMGIEGLRTLTLRPGEVSTRYRTWLDNPVRQRPFLLYRGNLVVVAPSAILSAIRDTIIRKAQEYGVHQALTTAFREAVQSRVRQYASLQGWRRISGHLQREGSTTFYETFFQFDTDKIAIAYTISDDLQTGSMEPENCYWDLKPAIEDVESRIAAVQQSCFASDDPPAEILHLVCVQGMGRPHMLGLGETTDHRVLRIALSADELRVTTLLNLNDSLALWQVARARRESATKTMVIGGFLEHYELFRTRRQSYYLGDERPPDLAVFFASALRVRLDAQARLDPHFVKRPLDDSYGLVMRLQSRSEFPIFTFPPFADRRVELLVEGLNVPVWIIADPGSATSAAEEQNLFFHLADAVAFWIWQLTPSLEAIERSCLGAEELLIHVGVLRPDAWLGVTAEADVSPPIEVTRVGNGQLRLDFAPAFAAASGLPDNSAERCLARLLVRGLFELIGKPLDDDAETSILERHAPLGAKRRFKVITGPVLEIVKSDGLPSPRRIQQYNESFWTDFLGSHLSQERAVGTISEDQRHTLCNQAVACLLWRVADSSCRAGGDWSYRGADYSARGTYCSTSVARNDCKWSPRLFWFFR